MRIDRDLHHRILHHAAEAVRATATCSKPFPHVLVESIFPEDFYRTALTQWPGSEVFRKASLKHHTDEYSSSTRSRINLIEASLAELPSGLQTFWRTLRAAVSSSELRSVLFEKLASGLARRFDDPGTVDAYPRGVFYSEVEGYRIAPTPTRARRSSRCSSPSRLTSA